MLNSDVLLIDEPFYNVKNNWMHPEAENLTLKWSSDTISSSPNAQVDIVLYGYRENNTGGIELKEVRCNIT